jgi:hypothetical protein
MDENFLELLLLLNEHKVRYLIIGGYAVVRYTEPRYTKDLDLWVEISEKNARALLRALEKFEAPTDNLSVKDLTTPGLIYIFGLPPTRIDIINRVSGGNFKRAWQLKEKVMINNVTTYFVDRKTLIKLKQSAGRPQDLADLIKLRKK